MFNLFYVYLLYLIQRKGRKVFGSISFILIFNVREEVI